jgi:hypothetical protein
MTALSKASINSKNPLFTGPCGTNGATFGEKLFIIDGINQLFINSDWTALNVSHNLR